MNTKNIAILIVEDDYNNREALKGHLQNLGYFKIVEATNSNEAIALIQKGTVIVTFLDIGLENSELDGIELGKKLNEISDTAIIFTTAYSDKTTISRTQDVKYQEYILKPLNERRVYVALELALKKQAITTTSNLPRSSKSFCPFTNQIEDVYIKSNSKFYDRVKTDDILYVKADSGGVRIESIDGKSFFTYTSLVSFLENIKGTDIIKIHHSHAVNLAHVIGKSESEVRLSDGTILPIGVKQKRKIEEMFNIVRPKSQK